MTNTRGPHLSRRRKSSVRPDGQGKAQRELARSTAEPVDESWQEKEAALKESFYGAGLAICHQQEAEALRASLREKEALLKEVHHRVKNNLQVITSLLRLEAGRSAEAATRVVLKSMQGRIQAMALLHETLYRSGTFASVDLGAYLKQLATQSFRALGAHPGSVQLDLELASVRVDMEQTIPCGLLVNELISNCLKHAFPSGRTGGIRVELKPIDGSRQLRLRVSDTGIGLPADFEAKRGNSLGLQLASDLAKQLGGRLDIDAGPGAGFGLTFMVAGSPAD